MGRLSIATQGWRRLGALLGAGCLVLAHLGAAHAQIAPPRTLDELKEEVQARADRRAYPVAALDPAEVKEALSNLKSLDRDEWAAVWSAIGDRHVAAAKAVVANDRRTASRQYRDAVEYYLFARFPLENSPGKSKAYAQALSAFAAYAALQDPPIEVVNIPFEGGMITGYLRVPRNVRPAPLVITIGGLDGRKENAAIRNELYVAYGVAYLALDMPGTGQSSIRVAAPDLSSEQVDPVTIGAGSDELWRSRRNPAPKP